MAHKTLVGGTAYKISSGKTLIGGTAYSIAGGKTLVGGTAYTISFATTITFSLRDNDEDVTSGYAGTYSCIAGQTWRELCNSDVIPFNCDADGYVYRGRYSLSVDGDSCPTDGSSYSIYVD